MISLAVAAAGWVGVSSPGDYAALKFPPTPRHDPNLGEVQDLRREARALKECVADLTLENRLLKKSMIADGGDDE